MTQLPFNQNLSISKLSSVFRSTSATYKFYWFWAILEAVEEGQVIIKKEDLFSRMIGLSWYTVNYFKVSFGTQDLIQNAVKELKQLEGLQVDSSQKEITNKLINSKNARTYSVLKHFDKNVPHKFLSPWLGSENKSTSYRNSQIATNNTPYSLYNDSIIISDNWLEYFKLHSAILKTYCYWHLSLFLQKKNPNVPDIPNKILRPIKRGSLNKHKIKFWDIVIKETGPIECIYTGESLGIGEYVIEHFLPHQFVAHDLMWNLIPADHTFNLTKSDKLPNFSLHFDKFYELQKRGIETISQLNKKNTFLQDYYPLFPDLEVSRDRFQEHIKPMLSIAHNNGFQYL
ncbi:HNH endonuclease domain-containing protein [Patiriisocius sp. Uisw_017]|uniref:HNH endonuclease domain-containing protein n=1 Tax=Patiriisocius sp. Uisw_017 TaxID=3230968 RepID=UPI0039E790E2